VLGAFPTLADYARLEARGNELGQTFQIQRSTLGLESQPGRQNAASVSSTSTTRKPSSSAKTRDPVSMFRPSDEEVLAEYQCLLRRQIEFFEASPEDVSSNAQGRNKPIQLGQSAFARIVLVLYAPPRSCLVSHLPTSSSCRIQLASVASTASTCPPRSALVGPCTTRPSCSACTRARRTWP
jgi:hypothetical protein